MFNCVGCVHYIFTGKAAGAPCSNLMFFLIKRPSHPGHCVLIHRMKLYEYRNANGVKISVKMRSPEHYGILPVLSGDCCNAGQFHPDRHNAPDGSSAPAAFSSKSQVTFDGRFIAYSPLPINEGPYVRSRGRPANRNKTLSVIIPNRQ
ncbi:hypothetical protein C3986_04114 [Escherichia coli]|nr:hypothetical protein C3986_04114 [Escherichia coli]